MLQLSSRNAIAGRHTVAPMTAMGGLGATTQQVAGTAIGGASAAIGIAAAAAWIPLAAVPFIGPALAAISLGIAAILNSGCGQTCVVTSQWANQAEELLRQNIEAYFALPAPRTTVQQAAAVANFLQVWNTLVSQCSNPSVGAAGQSCISDRQAGACHWTQPAASVPPWGTPAAGQCWNWWNGYHDPIANDQVVEASTSQQVVGAADTVTSDLTSAIDQVTGGSISTSTIALGLGLFLVVLAVSQ